jgi:hypothetical protein
MREIINQVIATDSVTYMFDDGSVVWICLQPTTAVNEQTLMTARNTAYRFLNNLNPAGRWEGKIDGAGNILESPIKTG